MALATKLSPNNPLRLRRRHVAATGAAIAAVVLGASGLAIASASTPNTGLSPHTGAQLQSIKTAGYSAALVNSVHKTLYLLTGETTALLKCKTTCLTTWPPMLVASSVAHVSIGTGVSGHVGFVKRSATTKQVTYNGHPLYRYFNDKLAGQANGQGLGQTGGGIWEMVHAGATTSLATPYVPNISLRSASPAGFIHILTNTSNVTLYALSAESTTVLHCTGPCLGVWPPFIVNSTLSAFRVGTGVLGHIGFIARSATTKQVTFNGFPVYRYSGDFGPGTVNGQGIVADGGTWDAINAGATTTGTTQNTTPPATTTTTVYNPGG